MSSAARKERRENSSLGVEDVSQGHERVVDAEKKGICDARHAGMYRHEFDKPPCDASRGSGMETEVVKVLEAVLKDHLEGFDTIGARYLPDGAIGEPVVAEPCQPVACPKN